MGQIDQLSRWRYHHRLHLLHLLGREYQQRGMACYLQEETEYGILYWQDLPVLTYYSNGRLSLRSCGYHQSLLLTFLNTVFKVLGREERLVSGNGEWFLCAGPNQGEIPTFLGPYGLEKILHLPA